MPEVVRDAMLAELHLTEDDVLYDLGCGDGRVLIEAYRQYGCKGVGIEIAPQTANLARRNVAAIGLADQIRIVTGNVLAYRYEGATAATVYLYPDLVARLAPKLASVDRVASYSHEIPGRPCRRIMVAGQYPIFISDSSTQTVAEDTWSWLESSGERGAF